MEEMIAELRPMVFLFWILTISISIIVVAIVIDSVRTIFKKQGDDDSDRNFPGGLS